MIRSALITISIAALTLAGCGKKAEPVDEGSTVAGAPSSTAVAQTPDQIFANAAAASDAFEIQASNLAVSKGQSAKIKRFAGEMVKAHTDSTAKLTAAAAQALPAIVPAAQLTASQQQTLDVLATKTGAEFDTAYAQAQVDAHQMTLDTLKSYTAAGGAGPLKAFAAALIPVVTAHLNMAKSL